MWVFSMNPFLINIWWFWCQNSPFFHLSWTWVFFVQNWSWRKVADTVWRPSFENQFYLTLPVRVISWSLITVVVPSLKKNLLWVLFVFSVWRIQDNKHANTSAKMLWNNWRKAAFLDKSFFWLTITHHHKNRI